MNWLRINAMVQRHIYVLMRSPHRLFDVAFWPLIDTILYGSIGIFALSESASERAGVVYILSGFVLYHLIWQSSLSLSTGFLEETWNRNVLNFMVTPLREFEYVVAIGLVGIARTVLGLTTISLTAVLLYSTNITEVGLALIPIGAILLIVGWALGLVVIALVLRYGHSAEILAWGATGLLLPLSGVFFPTESLPTVLEPIANILPSTYAFVAARSVLGGSAIPWDQLAIAAGGSLVAMLLALTYMRHALKVFRARGLVTRFS